jgi:hypothetical protein
LILSDEKDSKLGDVLKKIVSTGIGAAFMTEEAIKERLGDIPLPKDVLNQILGQAKGARAEFVGTIKSEIKGILGSVDISKEIDKVISNYDIEVNATFKFKPKKSSPPKKK